VPYYDSYIHKKEYTVSNIHLSYTQRNIYKYAYIHEYLFLIDDKALL